MANPEHLEPPFEAYAGSEPFLFVSYSHKDKAIVYPELERLQRLGFRIWYDEGIDPGNEWPEVIADALKRSAFFLVFISARSVASKNVKNEISLAIARDKRFVAVYLEETTLSGGLELRMADTQAVYLYRMRPESYHRAMEKALPASLKNSAPVSDGPHISLATPPPTTRPAVFVVPPPPVVRPLALPLAQERIVAEEKPPPKAGAVRTVEVARGVALKLVWCPPGSFKMGSPADEPDRSSAETLHPVTLTQGFWLGCTEVTQGQWEAVMGSNPSHFKGANLPVEKVSWEDCQEFIQKLCEKEGVSQGTYRLPTEAQWEYACRAGTTTPFHYGGDLDASMANFDGNYPYGRGSRGEYRQKTMPVGSFQPNAWGLYDMHGNVMEWCADWYGEYPSGSATDPAGPGSGSFRVLRGGGWLDFARFCRSARRIRVAPGYRNDDLGFRLLRMDSSCPNAR